MMENLRENLRGAWEVRAGIIPGTAMPEYTKQFFYLSSECEADRALPPDTDKLSRFQQLMQEAHTYAQSITQPAYVNWVELTWIWY